MPFWNKIFNVWKGIGTGPLGQESPEGAGVSTQGAVPLAALSDAHPSLGDAYTSYRETNDYIDMTTPMNRQQRYKEYDRLDNTVPEVASALNVYADDASQQDEDGHTFKVYTKNKAVQDELNFLFFQLLEIDDSMWGRFRNLCKYGDWFTELVIDPAHPEDGIQKVRDLPVETMWRIETVRGRLLEFQQSTWGPDYRLLSDQSHTGWNTPGAWQFQIQGMAELQKGPVIRFTPDQIIHVRIGFERKGFYPYGVSVVENAKSPAHSLKMMEDAMLVYRLTRAPERRIFYIDVGMTPPNRVESFVERIKDKFKKRKIFNVTSGGVDERFNPLAQDEDFFMPIRPNTNSRVETLPGGQNLGEIDDTKYFKDKLFQAMTIPKSYFGQEDISMTRLSLSAQDMKFARVVDRIQKSMARGLREIARRHLLLRGVPEEDFEDLRIVLTPSSDWRELARSEVMDARVNRAGSISTLNIMSPKRILVEILKYTEEEAESIVEEYNDSVIERSVIEAKAQAEAQKIAGEGGDFEGGEDLGFGGGMGGIGGADLGAEPGSALPPPAGEMPSEGEMELLTPSETGGEGPEVKDFEREELDQEEIDQGEI